MFQEYCPQWEGCLPQCMLGYTPLADTPPLGRHPPGRHPLGRHPPPSACWDTPPAQCILGYTLLSSVCWDRHGYCCGRYASYRNAFLSLKGFYSGYLRLAGTSTVTSVSVYCDEAAICYDSNKLTDGNADPLFDHESCAETG